MRSNAVSQLGQLGQLNSVPHWKKKKKKKKNRPWLPCLRKPSSLSLKTQFDTLLYLQFPNSKLFQNPIFSRNKQRNHQQHSNWVLYSVVQEEFDVIPVQSQDITDMEEGVVLGREDDGSDLAGQVSQVGGFSDGTLSFEGFSSATSSSSSIGDGRESEDTEKLIDRSINATIVLAAGTFAITKLLTIDQDYWQGWTIFEILRYAPQHNWIVYEEALKTNPVLAKMMISGGIRLHIHYVSFPGASDSILVSGMFVQAGWKLWPFAHLVTYGLIPLEQRLLWVDSVELIWVTILST
ncbi:hypothetical protein EZV62_008362 [Acer yangbiense]|uniref:Uncharacterized protein n=1 Tax=Acer yangbiense TaxID=1000413 RepID=A0A5C7ICX4_9ROSI|nr:hypothetical protein EZV62_008362 [Acer yangbiense]